MMKYQAMKKGSGVWMDCSKDEYDSYKTHPLSLVYSVKELPSKEKKASKGKPSPLTEEK